MFKERYRVRHLECCDRQMFGDMIVTCPTYSRVMPKKLIQPVPITVKPVETPVEIVRRHLMEAEKRRASLLVDQLLMDIHNSIQHTTDYNSTTSGRSSQQKFGHVMTHDLWLRDTEDLKALVVLLGSQIERVGVKLVRRLKRREALRRQQEARCDVITSQLKKLLSDTPEDMCFTVNPQSGESGFSQWVTAMKMVAQLPGGIPPEFRKRLWLTMAEKHLASKGVDWNKVERTCFSEWAHPEDGELGVQIVKDLHRTGCSLFCGEGGQENQALLKKVLLAYARWNKAVGYCQGFNMLAALILQVTDRSETDALKLMIYLIEGVLPDSYFADSLRGLSVDMAVFRELLRTRLPNLSKHLDLLQNSSKEGTTSYEPPLTNVFTMQWFLTLFCNCLPQPSVLRIWDLILLEGNEILLRTALAIWQTLADKILRVRTADQFYCIMGILTTELLENNLIDANSLIKAVVSIGPLTELKSLREHYLYNINPLGPLPPNLRMAEKQLKIHPKERINLDISTLKKQYMKLRQRQRQAHIIFSAAISRQPPSKAPVAMNHLLLGKSALVPAKRLGPPKGSIPPARVPSTLHWKDTKQTSSSSSSDTELCDDDNAPSDSSDDVDGKSTMPDLPQDNPNTSDTGNVEGDVQEIPSVAVETEDNTKDQKSDILDLVSSDFEVDKLVEVDSEDDSVDFELFLEDRVKSLKEDGENKKVTLSRRNSERALQIIQENSLILHRILQCQSRLSLSPPATETINDLDEESTSKSPEDFVAKDEKMSPFETEDNSESSTLHADLHKKNHPDINLDGLEETQLKDEDVTTTSKYEDILRKSRSLNEKCDGLFSTNSEITEIASKTITGQEKLIDFTTDSLVKNDRLDDSEVEFDENKVRPWLEKIDLNRNTEYPLDTKRMEEQTTQQNDLAEISEGMNIEKPRQAGAIIPDMVVSFPESRKNSEKDAENTLADLDFEWTKKYLKERKMKTDYDDKSETSSSVYISKLDTPNFRISERKSLSATNSIEKAEKSEGRRSLSATNSMERTTSPSSRDTREEVFSMYRRTIKSPDIPFESGILSPPRSRLSSSNSRELTSPLNESSISISSRVTSPSPERDETYSRLSPRRGYQTGKDDYNTDEFSALRRSRSPQKTFELEDDPRNSWEYKNYRESKERIERKLYGESSGFSKTSERGFRNSSPSAVSEDSSFSTGESSSSKIFKSQGENSFLDYESSPSHKTSSLCDEEMRKRNLKLLEDTDSGLYKYQTSPKLRSPETGSYSSRSSPLPRLEERRGSISPKSPNKIFNPFPVPLSSRQNKEIGVKLGLYKK